MNHELFNKLKRIMTRKAAKVTFNIRIIIPYTRKLQHIDVPGIVGPLKHYDIVKLQQIHQMDQ